MKLLYERSNVIDSEFILSQYEDLLDDILNLSSGLKFNVALQEGSNKNIFTLEDIETLIIRSKTSLDLIRNSTIKRRDGTMDFGKQSLIQKYDEDVKHKLETLRRFCLKNSNSLYSSTLRLTYASAFNDMVERLENLERSYNRIGESYKVFKKLEIVNIELLKQNIDR